MLRFALTIFLSAFLLFQVQPLIGKYVLPWFGGGPGVWTACLLMFQVLLLAGYAYAHWTSTRLGPRRQALLHLVLLIVSCCTLPIVPDESWKPQGDESPTLRILLLLGGTIGLPYFLLSTTGPLLQSWFAQTFPGRSPFRLYALSNAGSLLALFTYPLCFEPWLPLGRQAGLWSLAYVVFALLAGWNALRFARLSAVAGGAVASDIVVATSAEPVTRGTRALWLLLSASASVLLIATTNQLCQQVAVTPFLWIVPLAVYLASFILTFDAPRWYRREVFGPLLALSAAAAWYVVDNGPAVRLDVQLAVYCITLFAGCMTCHGELVRAKPQPAQLTLFYLLISCGGALGGLLTAVVAPRWFGGYWEYQLGLAACCVLLLVCLDRDRTSRFYRLKPLGAWCVMGCGCMALCAALGKQALGRDGAEVAGSRNFYGVLRIVRREVPGGGEQLALVHGRIVHGVQWTDPAKRNLPTTYYGPTSGIGVAALRHPRRLSDPNGGTLRVGVVGLGAGTTAAYGRAGDYFRFYEINPDVTRLAREHFRFLHDTPAAVDVVSADARIALERELRDGRPQRFDILAVDAFSGDAVPMHLLTRECFALYRAHLADDGLLALHVSNDHVDLTPVVRAAADELGWSLRSIGSSDDPATGTQKSDWLIVTANRAFLDDPTTAAHFRPLIFAGPPVLWTDDAGSLRQVLK